MFKNKARYGQQKGTIGLALLLLACSSITNAYANNTSKAYRAMLSIEGTGAPPNAEVALSTGPKQVLTAKSDRAGKFSFSNLQYSSISTLKFSLDIPPNDSGVAKRMPANHLNIVYEPRGSKTRIEGNIGKSGAIAFYLAGSKQPLNQIAGQDGAISLQTRTGLNLSSGQSQLTASIMNVGEVCCPQMTVPATPLLIKISSASMMQEAIPKAVEPISPTKPASVIPYIQQKQFVPVAPTTPSSTEEKKDKTDPENTPKPEKKKIPYLVSGTVVMDGITIQTDVYSAAQFAAEDADFDRTYVGGLKKMTDDIRNAITLHIGALGAFIDARVFEDAMRSIQNLATNTMKDYAPSDKVCEFGTMSRSLALSEDRALASNKVFSKFILDRNNQYRNTLYGEPGIGITMHIDEFQHKYCDISDNGGNFIQTTSLDNYCFDTAKNDLIFNRDVDFTRVFDIPLTFDADFTVPDASIESQNLFALFHNLTLAEPYVDESGNALDPNKNLLTLQDGRSIYAARQVAASSFGALVGERVKTSGVSAANMRAMINRLGLTDPKEVDKYLGKEPSYFAQMELLSKKMYQDPAFYANLYDSPANVGRQQVAMKAIELMQERDLLESLRRREMLLSSLINLRMTKNVNFASENASMTAQ